MPVRTRRISRLVALFGQFLFVAIGCQSSSDDTRSAADGGPLKCWKSIQELCVTEQYTCVMTWPDDPKVFCTHVSGYPRVVDPCGAYHAVMAQGVDVSNRYYYDAATGQLVAMVSYSANSRETKCVGPSEFVEPTCPVTGDLVDCSPGDASADGAAGMAGK